MSKLSTLSDLRARTILAVRAVADVTVKGLPAIRAAAHGARFAAGRAFNSQVLERLGISVIPTGTCAVGESITPTAGEVGIVFRRHGAVLRAGTDELVLQGREGLTVRMSPGRGATASATQDTVRSLAQTTSRGALLGIGRAALQGAVAGAVIEGVLGTAAVITAVRHGTLDRRAAVQQVGLHVARGAVVGAVGVTAAGAIAAGLTATGLSVVGVPAALPVVTMVAVGTYAGRLFDRVLRRRASDGITVKSSAGNS